MTEPGLDPESDLAVRPLTVGDAAAMVSVLSDPSLYAFTGGQPPSEEDLRSTYSYQVRGASPDGGEQWINLIVTVARQPVGYVQATVPTGAHTAEIAWVIGRPWQGRGFAKRATKLLLDHLSRDGVRTVSAFIHPDHAASQAVARAVGLRPTSEVVDGEVRWAGPIAVP